MPVDRVCQTCEEPFKARVEQVRRGKGRYCSHRCAALKQPREPLSTRLWARVTVSDGPDDCWPWTGYVNSDGYGIIAVGDGRLEGVHRVAFVLQGGVLDDEDKVLHRCDNPPCCRGAHLFRGSQADNVQDMIAKGRDRALAGEAASGAKLTLVEVEAIRSDLLQGVSVKQLAQVYGVHINSIYNIRKGLTWAHDASPSV